MLDLRRDRRLAPEPSPELRVLGELERDHLERHDPIRPLLTGLVDDTHTSAPGNGLDQEAV
jgi:hypothetical protein